ncbi:type II toxin-antitoxin system antitoxin SocA domain-containing protein [Solibacillus sp. CAU 1738]|uniref:Panacea domain-containing protein n=1 Tax=Solibacillus sp. CAU 1738 TaxID=3140363 RepID=UPI00326040BA
MVGMRSLADHVIAIGANKNLPVTNLQVQKVMFFTLGFHLQDNGIDALAEKIYDMPFEKWRYGPVVETVYYELCQFKDKPITEQGRYTAELSSLDSNIEQLLKINVFDLVELSHQLSSWADYKAEILNRRYVESYTLKEIWEDFVS